MSKILSKLPPIFEKLIGHRGAAGLAPENTQSAFIRAAQIGLNWVEFDTRICASGEWIVIHDATVNRTTNGTGRVEDLSYQTLKTLDAGSWFNPQFKNERIPLLSEALTCLIDLKIHPNIEIKPIQNPKEHKIRAFLNQLQLVWPTKLAPPLISSFDWEVLVILRNLAPKIPLGYIIKDLTISNIERVIHQGFNTLHGDYQTLSEAFLRYANERDLPICAYTVNRQDQIKKILKEGVTAVFSDLTHYDQK